MEYISIPSIVVGCYLLGELYKFIVKYDKSKYKAIPVLVGIFGGILGIIIFLISPQMMSQISNPVLAVLMGVLSGLSSTGGNQILKQLFEKNNED